MRLQQCHTIRISLHATVTACMLLLSACSTIDFEQPRSASQHVPASQSTQLGQLSDALTGDSDKNAFLPLADGLAAFGARLRLIEAAEQTIDMQYFLMKGDTAGEIIAGKLLEAADRGVRVRILLDDVFTTVKDHELAIIAKHPNAEVRLYNPVSRRGFYYMNYFADFKRANRRMHSKSFTVDGAASIVGGRNIADEYFQLKTKARFLDFDILVLGPVVSDVAKQFDSFWNDQRAIPIELIDQKFDEDELERAAREIEEELRNSASSRYAAAVDANYMRELISGSGGLYFAEASLISDTPEKLANPVGEDYMNVVMSLTELARESTDEIVIINPYFIPQEVGMNFWEERRNEGIKLTIVTNSLASNNHTPVHSAYTRYRKDLIDLGAYLYETRVNAVSEDGEAEALTLHTKLIVLDKRYLFVGSLNLDPRSTEINAEMGLLIDSPKMAQKVDELLYTDLQTHVYRLQLNEKKQLRWIARIDGNETIYTKEPETSLWKRFLSKFYRVLPESQL